MKGSFAVEDVSLILSDISNQANISLVIDNVKPFCLTKCSSLKRKII